MDGSPAFSLVCHGILVVVSAVCIEAKWVNLLLKFIMPSHFSHHSGRKFLSFSSYPGNFRYPSPLPPSICLIFVHIVEIGFLKMVIVFLVIIVENGVIYNVLTFLNLNLKFFLRINLLNGLVVSV